MSSAGYIYTQLMEEASSAQHGPFYVTNVLEVNHEDLKVLVTSLSCSTGCSGFLALVCVLYLKAEVSFFPFPPTPTLFKPPNLDQ